MKITSLKQHRVVGYCKKKHPTLNAHFVVKRQVFVWSSCVLLRKGFYQTFVLQWKPAYKNLTFKNLLG